ncbi:PREDICTED: clusterin-associated protein 1-like, partial [Priapulus caudatus]|uniref:Clusterin-associated protein 1-like n=1 Tax=Priapulus caudatus TaxID=37621 RepID=A0ABM1FA71_PRICU
MSYRDLRNFTEMMRALGYHRLISLENFRSPNFPLVAEVLLWLVRRFEPNAESLTDIDTEQDRVMFITSVAQFMHSKAHIKLNTKKLYMADGYAVRELLKITSVLYNAMRTNQGNQDASSDDDNVSAKFKFDITGKINDLKLSRQLASEITTKGAFLYDLLGKEVELREIRSSAIAQPLDINEVEKGLRGAIKNVQEDMEKTTDMLNNIASNEANLDAKIEKRKSELDRNMKRLQTLQTVRPAFMDEYEKLESELEGVYQSYVDKFRNVAYLENQLEEYNRLEQERFDEAESKLKAMAQRVQDEDNKLATSGNESMSVDLNNIDNDDDILGETTERQIRPLRNSQRQSSSGTRSGHDSGRRPGENQRIFGTMAGAMSDDEQSLGSASDLDLEDEEDSEEELDIEGEVQGAQRQPHQILPEELEESDNDF